jgi:eukaryotic-like serine/threonine-protein kinase
VGAVRRGELMRYDIRAHSFAPYLDGLSAEDVTFSQDGQRIAYASCPDGMLWTSNTDGSNRRQLTFPPMEASLPSWSPDGSQIAFSARRPGGHWQIYLVPAAGGDPLPVLADGSDDLDPTWAPDGTALGFGGYSTAIRDTKRNAIHIFDLKTRLVTDLPGSAGMFSPRWSPDGRYMIAGASTYDKLFLFDFTTRKWQDLVSMFNGFPNWSRDGKCVYFVNGWLKALPVYRICLADRKLEHVTDLTAAGSLAQGRFGWWTGRAPDDSILALRDVSTEEIYALDVKFP